MIIQRVPDDWIDDQISRLRVVMNRPRATAKRGPFKPRNGSRQKAPMLLPKLAARYKKAGRPASAVYVLGVMHGLVMCRELASQQELRNITAAMPRGNVDL